MLGSATAMPAFADTDHESDHEDDWWGQWEKMEDQDAGPELKAKTANLVKLAFNKAPSLDRIKKLQEEYIIPGKCQDISVPKFNLEIWAKLLQKQNKNIKTQDLHFTNTVESHQAAYFRVQGDQLLLI